MTDTIDPATCSPDQPYQGTYEGARCTMQRVDPNDSDPWRISSGSDPIWWADDSEVSDLVPLVPARPVTRDDLPCVDTLRTVESGPLPDGSSMVSYVFNPGIEYVLDRVVEHLNARGGIPHWSGIDWKARAEEAERRCVEWAGKWDTMRARAERAERADQRWSNEDLEAEVRRRTQCLRDNLRGVTLARDEWERRFHDLHRDLIDREIQPAPAVTRADIEKAVRSCPAVGDWNGPRVRASVAIEAVWALVSGDDPAVHVVRESDLPEVTRDDSGGDPRRVAGDVHLGVKSSASSARRCARTMLQRAAAYEAIARAIEAEQHAIEQVARIIRDGDPEGMGYAQAHNIARALPEAARAAIVDAARTERDAAASSSRWEETDDE